MSCYCHQLLSEYTLHLVRWHLRLVSFLAFLIFNLFIRLHWVLVVAHRIFLAHRTHKWCALFRKDGEKGKTHFMNTSRWAGGSLPAAPTLLFCFWTMGICSLFTHFKRKQWCRTWASRSAIQEKARDFPDGPLVRTPCSHCRGHRFDSWFGDQDSACHRAVPKNEKV